MTLKQSGGKKLAKCNIAVSTIQSIRLTLLRPGFFLLSMSGGGGGRFDPTLWQLITFEPLTIAIPFLLREMQNLFFNLIIYFWL